MIDFAAARRTMVENQLRPYDVTDQALLMAFETVSREAFVEERQTALAYLDRELTARGGKARLLTPMVLARMIQALAVTPAVRALDVGGVGYGAALLKKLGAEVVALDRDANASRASLAAAGVSGVDALEGPLQAGAPSKAPFDVILVHGAAETEPSELLRQLADGGRLAIVIGRGRSGRATIFRKLGSAISRSAVFDASAPLLDDFASKPAFQF